MKLIVALVFLVSVMLTARALIQSGAAYREVIMRLQNHDFGNTIIREIQKGQNGTTFCCNITRLMERMRSKPNNSTVVKVKGLNGSVTLEASKPQKAIGPPAAKITMLHLGNGFKYPQYIDLREAYRVKMLNGTNIIRETPINPHPFVYLHRPTPCNFEKNASRPILILVKSAVRNVVMRIGVRRTWGNIQDPSIRLVFMLGHNSTDVELQKSVDQEARTYGDIIQEDFVDNYHNNTYKTIMAFNWVVSDCPRSKVNYFVDDDYLVLLPNLVHYIRHLLTPPTVENIFMGLLVPHSRPFSNPESKWFVPMTEYRYDFWVPYLAGGAFIVSDVVVRKFVFAFPYVKFLRIDDSYLGIVAYKMGVRPQPNMLFNYNRGNIKLNRKALWFSSHEFKNPVEHERSWKSLMSFLK